MQVRRLPMPFLAFVTLIIAGCSLGAAPQAQALSIVPFFDRSIVAAANGGEIESRINSSVGFYETNFSNAARVKIIFQLGPTGLAHSRSAVYGIPYSQYVGLLKNDVNYHDSYALSAAVQNLPNGNMPQPGGSLVATAADLRSLGMASALGAYGTDGVYGHGDYDGVIQLSNFVDNGVPRLAYGDVVSASQYGAEQAIQHEIVEVLGIGGSGSFVDSTSFPGSIGAMDLYRYSGDHTPSFVPAGFAYFSVNGGIEPVAYFNRQNGADAGDWATLCSEARVQDAYGCKGVQQFGLTPDAPEVIALQAIGYNFEPVVPVPEPATWALMLIGFFGLGATLRRRRAVTA